jgi:hypothetical protein
MTAIVCPVCGEPMRVTGTRKGAPNEVVMTFAHECQGPKGKREDAPAPAPGSSDGPMRYGRRAGPETPAVGMPPIPLAPPRPFDIVC